MVRPVFKVLGILVVLFLLAVGVVLYSIHYQEEAALRKARFAACLLYTSPSPRDLSTSRMPSSA